MDDNNLFDMYGRTASKAPVSTSSSAEKAKAAARVLGGLKGQGTHTKTMEIEGELVSFPRAEYVKLLEDQIKEAKSKIRDLETKQNRLIRANNKIMEKIRQLEADLKNKVDLR